MRFPFTILLLAFVLLAPAGAHADDVKDALRLARAGDGATAVQNLKPLAERGSVDAQYALGVIYANGDGLAVDYAQAQRWFEDAAKNGNADARRHVAFMRQIGLVAAVPVAPTPDGEFRVQLATVSKEIDGPKEWKRLQRRFPEQLNALEGAIVPFDGPNGDHFFRVQGGPLSENSARELCAHLRDQGTGCRVVKP